MKAQKPDIGLRHTIIALTVVIVLVVLMDIVQFKLEKRLGAAPAEVMLSPWEQCIVWNKWAEWPYVGQCPGDAQPGWYRK